MHNKEAAHETKAIGTLRVLLVATSYPTDMNDWRGLFIRQLADALARRTDLQLSLWAPPGERAVGIQDATTAAEAHWLEQLMQSGGIAHALRNTPLRGGWTSLILLRNLYRAYGRHADQLDLLHCNWLQTLLPAPSKLPVLVTVLGTDLRLLKFPLMSALLRWRMRKRPVVICPNADWMVEPLRKLFGRVATIQTVPLGIDAPWFKLERQIDLRTPPRWLVVTRLTRGKLGPLFEWGEPLFNCTTRELHLFGPMQEQTDIPAWVHYHGSATPKELCQTWFPQAHGLITLSRHSEGRPQVMLEAMAAGLPIIASQLPAHTDLLVHEQTGLLCETPEAFANSVDQLECLDKNYHIGTDARSWVRENIGTWDDCAERYVSLYRTLITKARL